MVRQFAKLGIQLEVRATDFNQFQDKTLKGKHQIFWAGWLADYPDAENFLFLLYGPNAKSKTEGENVANYENPEYDKLYRELQALDDGPQKQAIIDKMTAHGAAGRTVGVRLLPLGRSGLPAVGLQRQAVDPDPRHGQVLPGRPAAAGRQAGRVEPADLVADAAAVRLRRRPGVDRARAATRPGSGRRRCRSARRRCRRPKRPDAARAELPHPPRRLRRADPDRGQLLHLLPVLQRQHARRHGPPEHRRQAGDAGADRRSGRRSAATTGRSTGTRRRRAPPR